MNTAVIVKITRLRGHNQHYEHNVAPSLKRVINFSCCDHLLYLLVAFINLEYRISLPPGYH